MTEEYTKKLNDMTAHVKADNQQLDTLSRGITSLKSTSTGKISNKYSDIFYSA